MRKRTYVSMLDRRSLQEVFEYEKGKYVYVLWHKELPVCSGYGSWWSGVYPRLPIGAEFTPSHWRISVIRPSVDNRREVLDTLFREIQSVRAELRPPYIQGNVMDLDFQSLLRFEKIGVEYWDELHFDGSDIYLEEKRLLDYGELFLRARNAKGIYFLVEMIPVTSGMFIGYDVRVYVGKSKFCVQRALSRHCAKYGHKKRGEVMMNPEYTSYAVIICDDPAPDYVDLLEVAAIKWARSKMTFDGVCLSIKFENDNLQKHSSVYTHPAQEWLFPQDIPIWLVDYRAKAEAHRIERQFPDIPPPRSWQLRYPDLSLENFDWEQYRRDTMFLHIPETRDKTEVTAYISLLVNQWNADRPL